MNARNEDLEETNETRMEALLQEMFEEREEVARIETFEEAGVMTRNRGLVICFGDGTEYQITIVEDRRGW